MNVHPLRRGILVSPSDLVRAVGIPFSDEQLEAITAPLEPGVIIAGAGSGKTTVMAARVVWLVGTGAVRPDQVLGLTFTRKAAAELASRIRTSLQTAGVGTGNDDSEPVILTYDSFAARVVAEHGLWLGYDPDARMITGASRFRLAARVVADAAGPFERLSRLRPPSVVERLLGLDSDLQSHLVADADLDAETRAFLAELDSAPTYRGKPYQALSAAGAVAGERLELAALAREYQAVKRERGLVEFGDQMAAAARLARTVPQVATAVRSQVAVVLLDEYQDTSAAQATLLTHLFGPGGDRSGEGFPVTAVGDPFQAIYGWRGAAASNILSFAADFPRAGGAPAHRFTLTVNRRSGQRILDAANTLAEPLRTDPLIATDLSDTRLRAPEGTPPGRIVAASFDTWPDEVAWVADRIAASGRDTGGPWSQTAVLLRRNRDIGQVYTALVDRDVPAEIVGLGGLLHLPEIADVVATLAVLDDPTDNPDLVRLLTGPRWRIGRDDLALLGQRAQELARSVPAADVALDLDPLSLALADAVVDVDPTEVVSLADALADLGTAGYSREARARFTAFSQELARLRDHVDEPVLDLIRRVVATLGLEVELSADPALAHQGRAQQLAAFVDAAAAYVDVDSDASLAGLLGYLRAELDHGSGLDQAVPTASDSVKLLTVHRSKGLEWDVVHLPGLVSKVFPADRLTDNWVKSAASLPAGLRGDADSIPQLDDVSNPGLKAYDQALREQLRRSEDRLVYVAVTRARHELVATSYRWREAAVEPREPSPYFVRLLADARSGGEVGPQESGTETNPLDVDIRPVPWPAELDPAAAARRAEAAALVGSLREAAPGSPEHRRRVAVAVAQAPLEVSAQVDAWDADLARLLTEAQPPAGPVEVPVPSSMSTSQLLWAVRDPDTFAQRLVRPMPQAVSGAARTGTRFHEWVVAHYGSQPLVDVLDDDEDDPSPADLDALTGAFLAGRFADATPQTLEQPFTLLVGGRVISGRIDAVFTAGPDVPPGCLALVVDWKTGTGRPDPWQLAVYRVAWAEMAGIDPSLVAAGFYHVRDDRLELLADLPDRRGLDAVVTGIGGSPR